MCFVLTMHTEEHVYGQCQKHTENMIMTPIYRNPSAGGRGYTVSVVSSHVIFDPQGKSV